MVKKKKGKKKKKGAKKADGDPKDDEDKKNFLDIPAYMDPELHLPIVDLVIKLASPISDFFSKEFLNCYSYKVFVSNVN